MVDLINSRSQAFIVLNVFIKYSNYIQFTYTGKLHISIYTICVIFFFFFLLTLSFCSIRSDYLSNKTMWDECKEPAGIVTWHLTLFSMLLIMGLVQMALCAFQVINGLIGTICGDCCGCCGVQWNILSLYILNSTPPSNLWSELVKRFNMDARANVTILNY